MQSFESLLTKAKVIKMCERKIVESDELKLQAVLCEYQTIKNEMLQKFRHQLQMYSILITAIAIMGGYILTSKNYDLLLVIPVVSSALAFRYIWEQNIIVTLGNYLRIIEDEILPQIIGYRSKGLDKNWVRWEHYFIDHFPKPYFYKYAIELLFVVVPIFPALIFSVVVILQHLTLISIQINSVIPIPVHILMILIYLFLVCYLALKLWRA